MQAFWFSWADCSKPKGQMFVGVAIIPADNLDEAERLAHNKGLWPSLPERNLSTMVYRADMSAFDAGHLNRLLTREEVSELGDSITVSECASCRGQIRA